MISGNMHIGTVSTYLQSLKKVMDHQGDGAEYLFRGQSSDQYSLLPSIARNAHYLQHERDMIALAKNKRPDVFTNSMTPIELLSLLQHYGVPTRLLDVTENALVALYFACQSTINSKNDNGIVYVFKNIYPNKSNHAMVNAVADSSFILNFNDKKTVSLVNFFHAMLDQSYWKTTSAARNSHKEGEASYVEKHLSGTLFVNAPAFTMRQKIQQGKYILFPNDIVTDSAGDKFFTNTISPIDVSDSVVGKIIVSKEKKQSLLNELTILGVTEYSLFGDSIDIVCKGIKEKFK